MFMTNIMRLRSTMSASAPAGSVKKKNGSEATVAIRERNRAESLTRFIVQVAAVSCAATHVPETKLASHMLRKTGFRRAVQVEFVLIGVSDLMPNRYFQADPQYIPHCISSLRVKRSKISPSAFLCESREPKRIPNGTSHHKNCLWVGPKI